MFTKNMYNMFPQNSPSSYPRTATANGGDIFLNHYSSAADFSGLNEDPPAMENPYTNPKASKKDRHSKIYTSQGPRDRRVRLSIGVARKFFDLQESLGFDKPSKTLDWLLTKSKTAIKDLMEMREKGGDDNAKSGSSAAPSEEVDSGEKLASDKVKEVSNPQANLAKESRVKARARARERTREKLSFKKLNINGGGGGGGGHDLSPNIPMQFVNNQDLIEESILIKRKVKHHPSMLGFQQNLIISSSNYGGALPYAAGDHNWDISSCFTSSQSNICAILDQQKFMNG